MDYEIDFTTGLMNFLNQSDFGFKIIIFSYVESFIEYISLHSIHVLLVAETVGLFEFPTDRIDHIYMLFSIRGMSSQYPYKGVFKYQSVNNLLREFYLLYAEDCEVSQRAVQSNLGRTNIITCFSPIGGCSCTMFALGLAKVLSETESVLYVNMEPFAVLPFRDVSSGDLSDLIYFVGEKISNLKLKLKGMVSREEKLDYILPVKNSLDLFELTVEDIQFFMREVDGAYDNIVFDIGYFDLAVLGLLKMSSPIVIPCNNNSVSIKKLDAFYGQLKQLGVEEIKDQILTVIPPYNVELGKEGIGLQEIVRSEFGDYIRQFIKSLR